jgi:6-phosphogluconolactonase (cycloisomerase 2 family)
VSHDGGTVAVGLPGGLTLLRRETTTGKLTFAQSIAESDANGHGFNYCYGVAFSPDDAFLYVGTESDNSLTTCSLERTTSTFKTLSVVVDGLATRGVLKRVQDLCISPDGRHVYVASYDGGVGVFSTTKPDALVDE